MQSIEWCYLIISQIKTVMAIKVSCVLEDPKHWHHLKNYPFLYLIVCSIYENKQHKRWPFCLYSIYLMHNSACIAKLVHSFSILCKFYRYHVYMYTNFTHSISSRCFTKRFLFLYKSHLGAPISLGIVLHWKCEHKSFYILTKIYIFYSWNYIFPAFGFVFTEENRTKIHCVNVNISILSWT